MKTDAMSDGWLLSAQRKTARMAAKLLTRFIDHTETDQFKETHINRALSKRTDAVYVEIGVRHGDCFRKIMADKKIGIDPDPEDFGDHLGDGERFFKKTSDDFFAEDADTLFADRPVDVALVDGMHEFRQSLRDVLNLEKYMADGGVIFVHDCNPPTRKHADIRDGGAWNGDVWKAVYYIRARRHDLRFVTLDCDWGLGVLKGFRRRHARARIRQRAIDESLIEHIASLDYGVLDRSRDAILQLRPPVLTRLGAFI